jgi:hypothetical protein
VRTNSVGGHIRRMAVRCSYYLLKECFRPYKRPFLAENGRK